MSFPFPTQKVTTGRSYDFLSNPQNHKGSKQFNQSYFPSLLPGFPAAGQATFKLFTLPFSRRLTEERKARVGLFGALPYISCSQPLRVWHCSKTRYLAMTRTLGKEIIRYERYVLVKRICHTQVTCMYPHTRLSIISSMT